MANLDGELRSNSPIDRLPHVSSDPCSLFRATEIKSKRSRSEERHENAERYLDNQDDDDRYQSRSDDSYCESDIYQ
jgi:hypothetical protein